jgi:hypothetical protein
LTTTYVKAGGLVIAQISATIQPINVQPRKIFITMMAPESFLFQARMEGRK